MLTITLTDAELRPLIRQIVVEVLEQLDAQRHQTGTRLGLTETEAAEKLGVARHVLRDCRRRGELSASKIGKRVIYDPTELERFRHRRTA